MKAQFHPLFVLLLPFTAAAQTPITISTSPTISVGKIDSCNLPTTAALASLPVFTPTTNATWDLSSTAIQTVPVTYAYKAKTAGFSTASFSDSLAYTFGASAGTQYNVWRNVQQGSTAVNILGEEITKRQAKGLGAITGNNLDSILITPQVIAFATPIPIIKFPATMSSKWTATARRTVNFNVTVAAFSLSNAPAQHKQIITSLDSVVGWGKMKVPIPNKIGSTAIAVLQTQHLTIVLDSFFVNGSPAPATLLTALGITQGQSTTMATTFFYRANAYRPLLEANHSSGSHSSPLSRVYFHAIDLAEETGVSPITTTNGIRVYPNPLHSGRLQIDLGESNIKDWNYSMVNINGQLVTKGTIKLTSNQSTTIAVPHNLKAGIYYISLTNARTAATVLPLVID